MSVILFLFVGCAVLLLVRCVGDSDNIKTDDPRGVVYTGSLACRKCHQDVYDAYLQTSHYTSSQKASEKNIKGSFKQGQNIFTYTDKNKVLMQQRDSGLFQVNMVDSKEVDAHPIDVVIGGKNAQTYLYWSGKGSYELPVSYYKSVNSWGTSPGYSADHPNFNRFIGKACFECHSSYIKSELNGSVTTGIQEILQKNTLVYGIDCERCHGPAINHVNYHLAYPEAKSDKYLMYRNQLSRQQQNDMCASCHSGNDMQKANSLFGFRLGDTLANFILPWTSHTGAPNAEIDVHGKQFQLLSSSQCYLKSNTLTCVTCHDPHRAENSLAAYSTKCISCHQNTTHNFNDPNLSENKLKSNCIDCHMPQQASKAITFQANGQNAKSSYMLRTHKIAVYNNKQKVADIVNLIEKKKPA